MFALCSITEARHILFTTVLSDSFSLESVRGGANTCNHATLHKFALDHVILEMAYECRFFEKTFLRRPVAPETLDTTRYLVVRGLEHLQLSSFESGSLTMTYVSAL